MRIGRPECWFLVTVAMLLGPEALRGIRFMIDRRECFSHDVEYTRDTIHLSFVVVSVDAAWRYAHNGVDLLVKGPSGDQIRDVRGKTSEKFNMIAPRKGLYRFCFTNKSPHHKTIDFDIHISCYGPDDNQHAKNEHFVPLLEQIQKLREALHTVRF